MSDFVSGIWSIYVIVVTLVGIIGCAVFLWSQEGATYTIGKTTGHAWDENLEEYNNPLPRWWSWLFYITVIFSLGYLVLFPGLGSYQGALGWCSQSSDGARSCKDDQLGKEEAAVASAFVQYRNTDILTLARNPEAMETGKRLFMTYCMQCHGADGGGKRGFPNLTDGDWLYGGEPDVIEQTIKYGRMGVMTPHDESLSADAIRSLSAYVRSFSVPGIDNASAQKGRDVYMSDGVDCRTCHGDDLKGNKLLGAPNLTDNVWLYGSDEESVIHGITYGRNVGDGRSTQNRMPAWGDFIGDDKVRLLAAYVYSLSNR
jgi:cytochrome c oxidase cbb3-type subunit 3